MPETLPRHATPWVPSVKTERTVWGGGGGWELKEAKPVANSPGLPSLRLSSLLRRVCVGTAGP